MIYFNVNIRNPWWVDRFKSIRYWRDSTPFRHKYIEVHLIKNDNLLRIEFEFTTMQDYAGVVLELGLFGYEVHLAWCDGRHWDYQNGKWID